MLAAGAVFLLSSRALSADMGAPSHGVAMEIPPPEDTASIQEGERLATIYGCRDCHGEDLAGTLFVDDPTFMVLGAPNLTTGQGGSPAIYDPVAFERAVRHGIGADDRNLVIMPAHEYAPLMSDLELSRILAFARNTEPKANAPTQLKPGPAGRMALVMAEELVPARIIDHDAPHPDPKPEGVSREWGERFALACKGCHGENLAGGVHPAAPEGTPWAPNITPGNEAMAEWDLNRFSAAIRAGVGSDGQQLDTWMPWQFWARLTDDEVASIWAYISTIEPLPDNPPPDA